MYVFVCIIYSNVNDVLKFIQNVIKVDVLHSISIFKVSMFPKLLETVDLYLYISSVLRAKREISYQAGLFFDTDCDPHPFIIHLPLMFACIFRQNYKSLWIKVQHVCSVVYFFVALSQIFH